MIPLDPDLGVKNEFNGFKVNPLQAVEIYHIHCHFNDTEGSEKTALDLLESTKSMLVAAGEKPLHDHVWHEKNGPHDPWSWELWVENTKELSLVVSYLMSW
jgi:hypothetical protein